MIITIHHEDIFIDDRVLLFAINMQKELELNSHKGSIFDWNIEKDFPKWLYEFEYHKSKLIAALMAKNNDLKDEFCSDLSNYLCALWNIKTDFNLQKSHTLTESEIKII